MILPEKITLVLPDRAFDASAFLAEVAGTRAMLLYRAKATRNPAHLAIGRGRSLGQLQCAAGGTLPDLASRAHRRRAEQPGSQETSLRGRLARLLDTVTGAQPD
jgi:hypothetical protein